MAFILAVSNAYSLPQAVRLVHIAPLSGLPNCYRFGTGAWTRSHYPSGISAANTSRLRSPWRAGIFRSRSVKKSASPKGASSCAASYTAAASHAEQIGRASCRERVGQDVEIMAGAVPLKKKKNKIKKNNNT